MSGSDGRTVYSWDTNVFLALLKREQDKPIDDIIAVAVEIETGKSDLVVSTLVIVEMLDIIDDQQLASDFHAFLHRPNVLMVNVDPEIARQTAKMRNDWRKTSNTEPRNIQPPDAIIIATAIACNADVLHSFDDKVLRFHKTDIARNMPITPPKLASGQRVLKEDAPEPEAEIINAPEKEPRAIDVVPADTGASPAQSTQHAAAGQVEEQNEEAGDAQEGDVNGVNAEDLPVVTEQAQCSATESPEMQLPDASPALGQDVPPPSPPEPEASDPH